MSEEKKGLKFEEEGERIELEKKEEEERTNTSEERTMIIRDENGLNQLHSAAEGLAEAAESLVCVIKNAESQAGQGKEIILVRIKEAFKEVQSGYEYVVSLAEEQ